MLSGQNPKIVTYSTEEIKKHIQNNIDRLISKTLSYTNSFHHNPHTLVTSLKESVAEDINNIHTLQDLLKMEPTYAVRQLTHTIINELNFVRSHPLQLRLHLLSALYALSQQILTHFDDDTSSSIQIKMFLYSASIDTFYDYLRLYCEEKNPDSIFAYKYHSLIYDHFTKILPLHNELTDTLESIKRQGAQDIYDNSLNNPVQMFKFKLSQALYFTTLHNREQANTLYLEASSLLESMIALANVAPTAELSLQMSLFKGVLELYQVEHYIENQTGHNVNYRHAVNLSEVSQKIKTLLTNQHNAIQKILDQKPSLVGKEIEKDPKQPFYQKHFLCINSILSDLDAYLTNFKGNASELNAAHILNTTYKILLELRHLFNAFIDVKHIHEDIINMSHSCSELFDLLHNHFEQAAPALTGFDSQGDIPTFFKQAQKDYKQLQRQFIQDMLKIIEKDSKDKRIEHAKRLRLKNLLKNQTEKYHDILHEPQPKDDVAQSNAKEREQAYQAIIQTDEASKKKKKNKPKAKAAPTYHPKPKPKPKAQTKTEHTTATTNDALEKEKTKNTPSSLEVARTINDICEEDYALGGTWEEVTKPKKTDPTPTTPSKKHYRAYQSSSTEYPQDTTFKAPKHFVQPAKRQAHTQPVQAAPQKQWANQALNKIFALKSDSKITIESLKNRYKVFPLVYDFFTLLHKGSAHVALIGGFAISWYKSKPINDWDFVTNYEGIDQVFEQLKAAWPHANLVLLENPKHKNGKQYCIKGKLNIDNIIHYISIDINVRAGQLNLEEKLREADFSVNSNAMDYHGNVYSVNDGHADLLRSPATLKPNGNLSERIDASPEIWIRTLRTAEKLDLKQVPKPFNDILHEKASLLTTLPVAVLMSQFQALFMRGNALKTLEMMDKTLFNKLPTPLGIDYAHLSKDTQSFFEYCLSLFNRDFAAQIIAPGQGYRVIALLLFINHLDKAIDKETLMNDFFNHYYNEEKDQNMRYKFETNLSREFDVFHCLYQQHNHKEFDHVKLLADQFRSVSLTTPSETLNELPEAEFPLLGSTEKNPVTQYLPAATKQKASTAKPKSSAPLKPYKKKYSRSNG